MRCMECRLQSLMTQLGYTDLDVRVLFFPGAKVDQVVMNGKCLVGRESFDIIYLSAGINELSKKIYRHCIKQIFYSTEEIVNHLEMQFSVAAAKLSDIGKKVVVCELVGLSYDMYNNQESEPLPPPQ